MAGQNTPILTVTLNPALDLSARVGQMVAGPKLRLSAPVYEPGGGGVNVARAIHALGGDVLAWVALGGASGAQHLGLLQAQGVAVQPFAAPGETRQSWAITDDTGQQFRLQLPGADWPTALGPQALADILAHAAGLVVLSGSQPPGLEADFAQTLGQCLGPGRLMVDISGPALLQLVRAPRHAGRPALLRLDQAEAEGLAGQPLATVADSAEFARALVAEGVAAQVCIARGADGSVLADLTGAHHCRPPAVAVQSKVGAGDSFTGAFTLALAQGQTAPEALRLGTAAAASAVMTPGSALFRAEDMMRLQAQCDLAAL